MSIILYPKFYGLKANEAVCDKEDNSNVALSRAQYPSQILKVSKFKKSSIAYDKN